MRKLSMLFCLSLLLVFQIRVAAPADVEQMKFIKIASAPEQGSWYPVGQLVARWLHQEFPNIEVTSIPTGGATHNVRLMESNTVQIAMNVTPMVAAAFLGKPPFDKSHEYIRHVLSMGDMGPFLLTRKGKGIGSLSDLPGKRFVVGGRKKSMTDTFTELVLEKANLSYEAISAKGGIVAFESTDKAVDSFRDQHCDAAMLVASTHPTPFITSLALTQEFLFVPLPIVDTPGYTTCVIPKAAYPQLTADYPYPCSIITFTARSDVPQKIIYKLAEIIYRPGNMKEWDRYMPSAGWSTETMFKGNTIPIHPGAQGYYDEVMKRGRAK